MQIDIGSVLTAKKNWANVVAVLLATAICHGGVSAQTPRLRMGTPQVLSPLGSPLQVRIPIDVSGVDDSLSSSRFSLGARPPNAAVTFIERADVSVESVGDSAELVIRTRVAIEEPAVGIVIREQLPNGVRSREFILLLDPPSLAVAPSMERRSNVAAASAPVVAATPLPPVDAKKSSLPNVDTKKTILTRKPVPPASAASRSTAPNDALPTPAPLSFKAPAYTSGGPRLRLSAGGDFSSRQATTEAERDNLRARQFTLEMDDLTSVLLERENRILLLEKELAGLASRISVAERVISGSTTIAEVRSAAGQVPAPASTLPKQALPANAVMGDEESTLRPLSSWSLIAWILLLALIVVAAIAVWRLRPKSGPTSIAMQSADSREAKFAAAVPSRDVTRDSGRVYGALAASAALPAEPVQAQTMPIAPISSPAESKDFSPPEIHFELPELDEVESEANPSPASADAPYSASAQSARQLLIDSPARQKIHDLQSQYPDVSRLAPRVDLPQRLLQQAATLYEQGECEFAQRLLAFAAYSNANVESYWLALFEILYREKRSQDYLFNADLFHEIHARSTHWNEVARVGYLLNPAETLFAVASNWSHDPPVLGSWFPTDNDNSPPSARTGSFEFIK